MGGKQPESGYGTSKSQHELQAKIGAFMRVAPKGKNEPDRLGIKAIEAAKALGITDVGAVGKTGYNALREQIKKKYPE